MNKLVKLLDKKVVLRASMVDVIAGAAILVLNLLLATLGVGKYILEGYGNKYGVSPKTFPRVVFIAACVLSVLLIFEGLNGLRKKKEDEKTITFRLISLAVLADMALFVFTMVPLGYPIANMLMMIIMYWLTNGKSWVKCLLVSVIFTVCSILFFYTYLKLSIPMGLLSFMFK